MGNCTNCLVLRLLVVTLFTLSFVSGGVHYRRIRPVYKRQANLNVDQLSQQDEKPYEQPKPTQEQLDLIDHGQFDQKPQKPQEQEQEKLPGPKPGPPSKDGEDEEQIDAAGKKPEKKPEPEEEHKPGDPFSFSYDVNDNNGTEFSRKEESDGEVVKGEYRVLMPDGRMQIVSYTADWKNGYRANVTYEPAIPPATTKRPDEDETDIQPGGQTPKPDCVPDTKGGKGSYGKPGDKCPPPKNPDETEIDIQPGGFTPAPTTPMPDCGKGVKGAARDKSCPPEEGEEDIQPGGQMPKPKPNCPSGVKGAKRDKDCPPEEGEEDIQPGGQTPKPPPGLYDTPSQPYQVRNNPKFGYTYPDPVQHPEQIQPQSYQLPDTRVNPKVIKRSANQSPAIRPRSAILTRSAHGFKYFLI